MSTQQVGGHLLSGLFFLLPNPQRGKRALARGESAKSLNASHNWGANHSKQAEQFSGYPRIAARFERVRATRFFCIRCRRSADRQLSTSAQFCNDS